MVYDDVQFEHGGFQNRNRIRTAQGWRWLTVPIIHNYPQLIKNVKIAGNKWSTEHLRIIKHSYGKTPFFKEFFPIIEEALLTKHEFLIDLNLHLIKIFADILNIKVNYAKSSAFPYLGKEKNEKLISMCKYISADTYLSGSGAKGYIKETAFFDSNIKIIWHSYNHPIYQQNFAGFHPYMSIIDLLFNEGSQTKEIILKGGITSQETLPVAKSIIEPI